jgi:hypothetical protein
MAHKTGLKTPKVSYLVETEQIVVALIKMISNELFYSVQESDSNREIW